MSAESLLLDLIPDLPEPETLREQVAQEYVEAARQYASSSRRPNDPATRRYQEARREHEQMEGRWAAWSQEAPPAAPPGECACQEARRDRACLGCGMRLCPACHPEAAGTAHNRCGGPVWADGEPLGEERRNPAMRGF